jgi:hypothetical protein
VFFFEKIHKKLQKYFFLQILTRHIKGEMIKIDLSVRSPFDIEQGGESKVGTVILGCKKKK